MGGGAHAGPHLDIQEILVCPIGAADIKQALEMNFYVHRELRKLLENEDKSFTNGRVTRVHGHLVSIMIRLWSLPNGQ